MTAKHIRILSATLAVFCSMTFHIMAGDSNIAYVSMRRVFDEYHKTIKASAIMKARADTMELERKDFLNECKKLKTSLDTQIAEARDKSLTEAAREQKKEEAEETLIKLRKSEERLERFDRTSRRQFDEDMRDQQQALVEEIKTAIARHAKKKGFNMVLDISGKSLNNTEVIVFCDQQPDITDDIIAIINKDDSDETAKPANAAPAKREQSEP